MIETYTELIDKFSDLMESVHDNLVKNSVSSESINSFQVFFMGIRSSMKLGKTNCNELLKEASSWTEIFNKLTEYQTWDCLSYHLLRRIMDKYLQTSDSYSELNGKMDAYDREIATFLSNTRLVDFLDVYCEDDYYKEKFSLLKAKYHGNLNEMTLSDCHTRKGYIVCQLRLRSCALRLAVANDGCVVFFWHIPQCLTAHVKQVCKELKPDFGQAGVIELCIDDHVLYQVSN